MADLVSVEYEGTTALVIIANPPVNATSQAVRAGLLAAVAETDAKEDVRSVVLLCDGGTFIAGADIKDCPMLSRPLKMRTSRGLRRFTERRLAAAWKWRSDAAFASPSQPQKWDCRKSISA